MKKIRNPLIGAFLFACCLAMELEIAGCHRNLDTSLLPSSNEAAGWAKTGSTRSFPAAELWKYIDGEAEKYQKAGVKTVLTADYNYEGKFDAVVDLYTMESAAGPRKILESEPIGDAMSVQLGDEARLYGQSLIIRKRAYLLRIVVYQGSAETPRALLELGQAIDKKMSR